ncbi:MAG: Flp family type IVb pilin [Bryobacteraceae bacterium]
MQDLLLKLYIKMSLLKQEEGQDLIEYALVVSLIAFAAIAGMNSLATGINAAFNNIAAELATTA